MRLSGCVISYYIFHNRFFHLSSYFTQHTLSQLQICFLGLSAHLTNSYINKVTMTTSVWQIHSYNSIYRCDVQGEAEETVAYRAYYTTRHIPKAALRYIKLTLDPLSEQRNDRWQRSWNGAWILRYFVMWRACGKTSRLNSTGNNLISMRYEFQFLYSSASRNEIH